MKDLALILSHRLFPLIVMSLLPVSYVHREIRQIIEIDEII